MGVIVSSAISGSVDPTCTGNACTLCPVQTATFNLDDFCTATPITVNGMGVAFVVGNAETFTLMCAAGGVLTFVGGTTPETIANVTTITCS